jgi:hypothetical protein
MHERCLTVEHLEKLYFCREFESFAIGTLDQFEKKTKNLNFSILFRTCDRFNMSPVQIAIEFNRKEFISNPSIQDLIENYWLGHDYRQVRCKFLRIFADNLTFGFLHKFLKPKERLEIMVSVI